ncbi:MAG: transposase, partial [Deltaproteobacteria bacterium]|nr:transposase [Deltaproteobacteria bacterium]
MSDPSRQVPNNSEINAADLPLGGITYNKKENAIYGKYFKYVIGDDGKPRRTQVHLGRLINAELHIFRTKKRGYYTFTLENGYGEAPMSKQQSFLGEPPIFNVSQHETFHFGDAWLIDQLYKQSGLETVLDNLIPEASETLKALSCFRVLDDRAYCHVENWYCDSYARLLYPRAFIESQRISEFLSLIGEEHVYRKFFKYYLELIGKKIEIEQNISFPILIDSTDLPDSIKTHLTAISNHNGDVNNEIRLIYAVDKESKLPIYFRYIPGNIIDNTTLINTLNMLMTYDVTIEMIIMDAGYSSLNNLEQLAKANIPFITRLNKNTTIYKELMINYGKNLNQLENGFPYGARALYGRKTVIPFAGKQLYAYVLLDNHKGSIEQDKLVLKLGIGSEKTQKDIDKFESSGKFILISTEDYKLNDIIPLYYTRQLIEQTFDISKTYATLLPLRAHSEETLRGHLLISFIASVLYAMLGIKLANSLYCPCTALDKM